MNLLLCYVNENKGKRNILNCNNEEYFDCRIDCVVLIDNRYVVFLRICKFNWKQKKKVEHHDVHTRESESSGA